MQHQEATLEKVTGKDIRQIRMTQGRTQVQFAQWLSKETGEDISSREVCQMETYKKKGACSPLAPSTKVFNVIRPYLKKFSLMGDRLFPEKSRNLSSQVAFDQVGFVGRMDVDVVNDGRSVLWEELSSSTEEVSIVKEVSTVTEEQRKEIRRLASLYVKLGLLDAPGDSVEEMMMSIESDIRGMEKRLFGDVEAYDERSDLQEKLREIEEERRQIKDELEDIDAKIEKITSTSKAVA